MNLLLRLHVVKPAPSLLLVAFSWGYVYLRCIRDGKKDDQSPYGYVRPNFHKFCRG